MISAVKYYSKSDATHLINALKLAYTITLDKAGTNFYGLYLEWDYNHKWVDISMPKYVLKILKQLGHPFPLTQRHSPHRWVPKAYGQKVHLTAPEDHSEILSKLEKHKYNS